MKKVISDIRYGAKFPIYIGQKVECSYYHEYPRSYMKQAYKRSLLSRLIDKPFAPIKLGIVVGDAGIHPYWMRSSGEQYILVKFKEYVLPKPIPASCISYTP